MISYGGLLYVKKAEYVLLLVFYDYVHSVAAEKRYLQYYLVSKAVTYAPKKAELLQY